MFAKISTGAGMHDMLYYHERKVTARDAQCIYAGNFLKDAPELSFDDKKQRFDDLISLNQRTHKGAIHAILSFAPGEKLDDKTMTAIAREYMQRIGYGDQPYLVYRHDDTAYQHLHLVSTKIRPDGTRIPESFIGVSKSQPARRAIEEKYGLVRSAQAKKNTQHLPAREIKYGKQTTFQAISDTLREVLQTYNYRSLPELNAILGLYNLTAKTGRPGSRLHDNHGLLYQVLDPAGHRTTPIKASAFDFNPGLAWLEKRFTSKSAPDQKSLQRVTRTLDSAIRQNPAHADQFTDLLRRDQFAVIPTHDKQGALTDLFFIDLAARSVSRPSDLGPNYDAAALRSRLTFDPFPSPEKAKTQKQTQSPQQTQHLEKQKQKGRHL